MSSKKCRPESHFTLNSPLKKKNFNYKISIFNYDKPSQTTTPSTTNTAATTTTKNHKRNSKSSKNKDAVRQRFYEQVLRPSRTAETHANFFKTEPRKEQDTKSQQPQLPETIPASHPERSICTTRAHQFFGINWKVRGNSLQRQQFQFDQIKWKLDGTYRRCAMMRKWALYNTCRSNGMSPIIVSQPQWPQFQSQYPPLAWPQLLVWTRQTESLGYIQSPNLPQSTDTTHPNDTRTPQR